MYQPEIERISEDLYFVSASSAMRRLRTQIELLSQTDVPVLVTGEPGSGKCTAARLIHALSIRSGFAFVRVKCPVVTADMLEKELFGYELPGGDGPEAYAGKFEESARGTILLDDFEVMPSDVQKRLLHLLETGEYLRCGGKSSIRADARVIASSSADLEQAASEKKLQEELFYRLSAFQLRVPPLRERQGEVPLLLGHMINRLTRRYGVPAPRVSATLLDACQQHSWPGNLKELESFAKRYLAQGDEGAAISDLQARPGYGMAVKSKNGNGHSDPGLRPVAVIGGAQSHEEKGSLKSLVRNAKWEAEKGAIAEALDQTHWNRKAAARLLNVSYRALLYKIQEYHLNPPPSAVSRVFGPDTVREAK